MKVLVTDRFHVRDERILRSHPDVELIRAKNPGRPTAEELKDVVAMIVRSRTKIDKELLLLAPQLKLVVTSTSGFDHINFDDCAKNDVKVAYTPEANAASAAELTWALVLACARKIRKAHEMVQTENWDRSQLMGMELRGKVYGIIGLGRVGRRVARIANAMDMKVIAFDPYKSDEYFKEYQTQRVGITELFRMSQIVSVHVPKTKETSFFISKDFLADLGPEGIFVNTSRGEIIRNDDLTIPLEKGQIGSIGLDVFENEPPSKDLRIIQNPKVVLTPHIGATTHEALENSSLMAAQIVIDYLNGKTIADTLPPAETWYHTPHAR
ncbi:MAG: phosphoglycerate dehydrogenase [Bdellovibrionales bacterium]|nr:phosphoglycerate dehydrogenase [Bdellovibrionales bacterium]